MTRRAAALLTVLLGVLLTASPARAATTTVTLGQNGPSPSTATIKAGDTVLFSNTDSVSHTLKATSSNWSLSKVLPAGQKSSVTLTGAGTYTYSDTYPNAILGFSQTSNGSVVVPGSTPTPTTKPSATPKPSTTRPPVTASPTRPGSSPTAAPTQSGVAVPPPIIGGVVPTAEPTTSAGPQPQVAPSPEPSLSASPVPVAGQDYADPSGLVQDSAHGFGLPTALAVVAVVGVATLLVRLLLAQPEARPSAGTDVQ